MADLARASEALRAALSPRAVGMVVASVAAVSVLAMVAGQHVFRRPIDPAVIARLAAGLGVFGLWIALAQGLLRQNSPVAARLVPGHVTALRRVLVAAWLAGCGLLLLALPPAWRSAPVALGVAAGLLVLAAGLRWMWLWIGSWMLPFPLGVLNALRMREQRARRDGEADGFMASLLRAVEALADAVAGQSPALWLSVALVVGAWLLTRLVRQGGPAHLARPAGTWLCMKRAGEGTVSSSARAVTPFGRWLARAVEAPYRRWFARCVAVPAGVPERALLALGPGSHWTVHLAVAGVMASAVLALLLIPGIWFPVYRAALSRGSGAWGPMIGLMAAGVSPALSQAFAAARTAPEQGLVRLVPGAPAGAGWWRMLARRRLLHFLGGWAGGAGACALLMMRSPADLQATVAVGIAAVLPSIGVVLPSARVPEAGLRQQTLAFLAVFGLPFGAVLLHRAADVPAAPLVAASLLTALVAVALGWRRLPGTTRTPRPAVRA